MSKDMINPMPIPQYQSGESRNENPYGHSGVDGFGQLLSKDNFNELSYLKWLYEAKETMVMEHERQLLEDVKRLRKHKGNPKLLYPSPIDIGVWVHKANMEIVSITKNLIA